MSTSTLNDSSVSPEWTYIFFHLICPSMGCLVATAMFAAPIADLRRALIRQSLGDLNPRPWAVMTGNCLGWCAYAYYIHDPFILASNIPGLILSMWLNAGAAKLQYKQMIMSPTADHRPSILLTVNIANAQHAQHDVDHDECSDESYQVNTPPVFTPQEIWWLRVMIVWSLTLVWVGWVSPGYEAAAVGLLVNLNLIFFYAAPLQTITHVVRSGYSNSIHPPTMIMGCANASFWFLYGVALWDPVVMVPNSIGLILAICQVLLCGIYPRRESESRHQRSSSEQDDISMSQLPVRGIFHDLTLSKTQREDSEGHIPNKSVLPVLCESRTEMMSTGLKA